MRRSTPGARSTAAWTYRRLHLLLKREGIAVNWKKLYRIYKEERLTVRKRGGRKRALGARAPMAIPQDPNQRWSLDFVSDTLVDGRRFRILCVIDDFSRECLATVVDNSLSGERVHSGEHVNTGADESRSDGLTSFGRILRTVHLAERPCQAWTGG